MSAPKSCATTETGIAKSKLWRLGAVTLAALALAAGGADAQPLRLGEILSVDGARIHRWSGGEIESVGPLEGDPFLGEPIAIMPDGTILGARGAWLVRIDLASRQAFDLTEIPSASIRDLEVLSEAEVLVLDSAEDRIVAVRIDTGAIRPITQGGFLTSPQSIAVEEPEGLLVQNSELLYRVNTTTGMQALVQPLLVEDAEQIALDPGGESILVVDYDATSMSRVQLSNGEVSSVAPGAYTDVKYGPDGRLFAVAVFDFGGPDLVEIVGGEPQPIGSLGLFGYQIAISPVPEPDGALVPALLALAVLARRRHAAASLSAPCPPAAPFPGGSGRAVRRSSSE